MANPVLVEIFRGDHVESRHRGCVIAVDGDGRTVFEVGDVDLPVFPRSAIKAMQALPLVESGAADAFGFGNRELALACSSHSGQPEHIDLALAMLAKVGLDHSALECGCHWSSHEDVLIEQVRRGEEPNAAFNNCSGKHAGFICSACHQGLDFKGYIGRDHPIQAQIRDVMASLTGAGFGEDNCGTDGCSIPTYAVPPRATAHGFARMATGNGLSAERGKAAERLIEACMAEPFYVSGRGRACKELMEAAPGRIFAKTGAEGVFCVALPDHGIGMTVKCDDGSGRGAEAITAASIARFFSGEDDVQARLLALATPAITNRNGWTVGSVRAAV